MTASADLTPVQWDAVQATATLHLRDPEELARELHSLLYIPRGETLSPAPADSDSAVNDELTPTTELPVLRPAGPSRTLDASGRHS